MFELITPSEEGQRQSSASPEKVVLNAFEAEPFVPLHHQIEQDLLLQLRSKRWKPGAALPSEPELCRHYGVSRGTMRQALGALSRAGIIERFAGRGSFVREPKSEAQFSASYRRFAVEGPSFERRCKVLSFQRRRPSPEVREILSLGPEEFIFRFERIRFVSGKPITIQSSYLAESICPSLTASDLEERHLVEIMRERHGIRFSHADEYLEPGLADDYVAEHLTIPVGSPVLKLEHRAFLSEERVGEYRHAVMRGDIHRFKVELR